MTSTGAERVFAIGRALDKRAGAQRDETRSGLLLGGMDDTAEFMRARPDAQREWKELRKRARKKLVVTMKMQREELGLQLRASRQERLAAKRAKRAARNAEKARLQAVVLATKFSELKAMGNDELKDQLRAHKLKGKSGFSVSLPNRTALVLQLQALLSEADPAANDLEAGDSGIDGRKVKSKVTGGGGRGKGSRKRKKTELYMGYEFDPDAEYQVEAIVGHLVADGKSDYANLVRCLAPSKHNMPAYSLPCVAGGEHQAEGGHRDLPHRLGELPARPHVV